ncbi:hypothetical protein HPP92_022599 [Vanilla planifolia]|uniref:Protein LURP-one-related 8 n=1 Tax=Vanilla planifolia TaxID=51239 RepID=A0A835UE16_VANPL|nr:hypothetical protein HPP92_022877 [Vanilla planifolia]KAG0459471.1 hypothetical protein HPP92_022599 [Vanilla planifolia]
MTKIYPNSPISSFQDPEISLESEPKVLTVWRKSLLFNCSGFTVYDGKGNLVFRVDIYPSSSRNDIVLMDSAGKPLFTVRRKKLSLADHWHIYDGEAVTERPRFSARKHLTLLPYKSNSKEVARVMPCRGPGSKDGPIYSVEGSFSQRACVVLDERRRQVAEIKRKEAVEGATFGGDVFRLVVQPGLDAGLAMAVVILLEQMFGSRASTIKG